MNTEIKKTLEKVLDLMPQHFSSLEFAKVARSLGVERRFTATGGCSRFLHRYCRQTTRKSWEKKEKYHAQKQEVKNDIFYTPEFIEETPNNPYDYYLIVRHSKTSYELYFSASISNTVDAQKLNIGKLDNRFFFLFDKNGAHQLKTVKTKYLGIYTAEICKAIVPNLLRDSTYTIGLIKVTDNLFFALPIKMTDIKRKPLNFGD